MSYSVAKKCFLENIRLTGGSQKDPIAFNLYNGLANLADQLEKNDRAFASELSRIRRDIDDVETLVKRLR